MNLIYQPSGRAAEYAEWAANPYEGCLHGCAYCFGPELPPWKISGRDRADYHARHCPKPRVLENLRADINTMTRNHPGANVLLSFTSDLYPPDEAICLVSGEIRIPGLAESDR